ncbi:hypothetical protein [Neolewinella litorea]|uniref:Uncharacterized protein n=1 Tax=Neolewinella litorea TaxID=2562452 RepID=A0A4S4NC45_9BACT|nr:hypothetical protein [Neolewinella litorea]THH35618.1 hypothetical protein E4021_16150 [Neolewinella litorea]
MAVRLTESRLPANFTAADLGQAATATDGRCVLVSFIPSPLVVGRPNSYVLFVTDAALVAAAQTYEWTFREGDHPPVVQSSDEGETTYQPVHAGPLTLTVRVLGAGNAEQASVALAQASVAPNATLEQQIAAASQQPGPGLGNPGVARELINDHNAYYQAAATQFAAGDEQFGCFLFSTVYDGALRQPADRRRQHVQQLAASLNNSLGNFAELAAEATGTCGIRLFLLAMSLGAAPPVPWTEIPETPAARPPVEAQLRTRINALDPTVKVDLFNLLRFPKSNIFQCARLLVALRDRYFAGASFNDVISGMSGTRAVWITRHLREGPILRNP